MQKIEIHTVTLFLEHYTTLFLSVIMHSKYKKEWRERNKQILQRLTLSQ